jgi:hypothetical protein
MTFVTQSPVLDSIAMKLAPLIETGEWPPWCNDWNYIMTSIKECVNDHGLRAAFVHQDVYCPIPWFLRQKPLKPNTVIHNAGCARESHESHGVWMLWFQGFPWAPWPWTPWPAWVHRFSWDPKAP